MNRYTALMVAFIFWSSLHGSQQVLRRTFSTNPATDLLKSAIQKGDVDELKNHITQLPIGVDYQYAYLGLSNSPEMSTYLLEALYHHWLTRMSTSPRDALTSLAVGLDRLFKSYKLDSLDHGFRCMLAKLKREFLKILLGDDVDLQEMMQKIPDYADEQNSDMAIAYNASFNPSHQANLLLAFSKVHRVTRGALPLQREEASC